MGEYAEYLTCHPLKMDKEFLSNQMNYRFIAMDSQFFNLHGKIE